MEDIKKKLQWLEIFLGYSCNLRCSFCFQKDLRKKNPKYIDEGVVRGVILEGFEQWKRSLIFSGWDPMGDKNLLSYVLYARELWYEDIRIHTNGIVLSSKEVFEKYVLAGVNGFILSVHGYGPVHDILVKLPWAFEKVFKALAHFVDLKKKYPYLVLDTNTVLTKHNYTTLHTLFKFLSFFPITRSQIVQLYSLGLFSQQEKSALYVTYEDFNPYLTRIIALYWRNITLENFPFCKVDISVYNNIISRQQYDNDAYWNIGENLEESSTTFIEKCRECEYRKQCTGIPKDYLQIFNF